ncbi:hypothetical protein F2P81_016250 [Scophthalmus maximus]|uniref:Uncharacterized protein n=1 Tax=Scophthalmus maximus TaxID=52904 RepID=A0A6A4SGE3_SCOMX|nr:hypothetical protein F2P81_016250 [Scophthalmus maximus]
MALRKESDPDWTVERSSDPAIACATSARKCRLLWKGLCKSALMPDNNMGDKTKYAAQGFDPVLELKRSFVPLRIVHYLPYPGQDIVYPFPDSLRVK